MKEPCLLYEKKDGEGEAEIDLTLYEYLGAHKEGERYVFRTYQPNASAVELTGDFNSWGAGPMKKTDKGFWEIWMDSDIPLEGNCYKYRIYNEEKCRMISDPCARYDQWGSYDSSIVYFDEYEWNDRSWMERKVKRAEVAPINIYQIHLGSWRIREGRRYSEGDRYLNYCDIAAELSGYVSDMGYTHICLTDLTEGREGDSFAPSSRYGRPDGLKCLVDILHNNNIGVIFEWKNLRKYEPNETDMSIALSSAAYWLMEFHADGIYFAEMPEKEILETLTRLFDTSLFIIEGESDDHCFVDRKWSEGAIDYAVSDPQYKRFKYSRLNLSLTEGFEKNRILAIKRADVSTGRSSLINKMRGEYDEKFARLRLFYCYMMTHPGKKLTFMGCEFGETAEWSADGQLDWFLIDHGSHKRFKRFVRSLNIIYKESPELWECDSSWRGFCWISPLDEQNGIMAFKRLSASGRTVTVALNFTDNRERELELDNACNMKTVLNSDAVELGGKGRGGIRRDGERLTVSVPPLSAIILKSSEK